MIFMGTTCTQHTDRIILNALLSFTEVAGMFLEMIGIGAVEMHLWKHD